ncbi:hypothetical protein O3G_MSEX008221 [Manduca sexta]|uniref:Uncharacterized protein n=1 Tax=Manduca sexta TaxID=7130 RepID=A0A921ZAX4_MANSE|nr:hypothetical protein O3G_MSEX008221 [Manduca sexta]
MGQLVLLCIVLCIGGGWAAIWEFGEDRKGSVVISTGSGDINIFQKTTRVQFPVPTCHQVVYVKVEVLNELTTPDVTYQKDTYTVVIHYKLLQSSVSKYYLTVKAIKEKNCGRQEKRKKKLKTKKYRPPPEESEEDSEEERRYRSKQRKLKKKYKSNQLGYPVPGSQKHVGQIYGCLTC